MNFYEEVFIPDPIREPKLRLLESNDNVRSIFQEQININNEAVEQKIEQTKENEYKPIECAAGGIDAKVILKNHFRLVVFYDKMNKYLFLDLFGMRQKLNMMYDKYGRLRKGVMSKLSDDFKIYRLSDDETGQNYIVKVQEIVCNRVDDAIGYVYSVWESPESREPVSIGITY